MDHTTGVLLLDNRELMRIGLKKALEAAHGLAVAGEAGSCRTAVRQIAELEPAVVVVGSTDDQPDPQHAIRALINSPVGVSNCRYLGMVETTTAHSNPIGGGSAPGQAGGMVLSRAHPQEVVSAIRMLAGGYTFYPSTGPTHDHSVPAEPDSTPTTITDRERDVLRLLAKGYSNTDISLRMRLRESTVKSHVQNLLMKLGVKNRVSVVIYAYELGLVKVGDNISELPQRYDRAAGPRRGRHISGI
ncbi:response regulator transcription factor [Nocardia sp. 004]|uniref:response regulator transcription factor n=1 Tax=Nocardia sp. 004 TaxID=3385978 RepID=UPI0039A27C69